MSGELAVAFSFFLYVLYVLLPIVPAVVIFKLFPDSKVAVSGPLQNWTIKATGAFGAYVITVALGFFLVSHIEQQINAMRTLYPVQGVIVNLDANEFVDSDQFFSRYVTVTTGGALSTRSYHFVMLKSTPQNERVSVNYWELNSGGGTGAAPAARRLEFELTANDAAPQRFRLRKKDGQLILEPESGPSHGISKASY